MSSMRSASSKATCLQVCRLSAFWPSKSTSRPGVATTSAGRSLRSVAACSLAGTPPPKTHAVFKPSRPQYLERKVREVGGATLESSWSQAEVKLE